MRQLVRVLQEAKRIEGPVLVHVVTQKGKGYGPAMRHPARFHGTTPFQIDTGIPAGKGGKSTYTDIFSTVMRKFGDREPKVVAVTAAMSTGTGLKRFGNMFPERFFDVGIAKTRSNFCGGTGTGRDDPGGGSLFFFSAESFDQTLMDVCMQNLHVIFAIDRAGLVGSDGETHQGAFDLPIFP